MESSARRFRGIDVSCEDCLPPAVMLCRFRLCEWIAENGDAEGLLLSYTAGDALKRGVSKLTPPGGRGQRPPPARIPASMVEGVVPRGRAGA